MADVPRPTRRPFTQIVQELLRWIQDYPIHFVCWSLGPVFVCLALWSVGFFGAAWVALKYLAAVAIGGLIALTGLAMLSKTRTVRDQQRAVATSTPPKPTDAYQEKMAERGAQILAAMTPGQYCCVRHGSSVIVRPTALPYFLEWDRLTLLDDQDGLDKMIEAGRAIRLRENVKVVVIQPITDEIVQRFLRVRAASQTEDRGTDPDDLIYATDYVDVRLCVTEKSALVEARLMYPVD